MNECDTGVSEVSFFVGKPEDKVFNLKLMLPFLSNLCLNFKIRKYNIEYILNIHKLRDFAAMEELKVVFYVANNCGIYFST